MNISRRLLVFGCFISSLYPGRAQARAYSNDQGLVAHFTMELAGNTTPETVSGKTFLVRNNFNRPENIPGAEGNALRCDGYSTFCNAQINATALSQSALTVSVWCALETNIVMDPDKYVATETYIAGNLNDNLKSGFAFTLNATGIYGFQVYIDGSKVTCSNFNDIFPIGGWQQLTAIVDPTQKELRLYRNGQLTSSISFFGKGLISTGEADFIIGKSFNDTYSGIFRTNTINGLIDDIRIYSRVLTNSEIAYSVPEHVADFSIPKSRHENDIQRPGFHGLPATNWTNEPHGLVYSDGKYHLFFQKNANGPYWGKLHWGHISSDDLLNWKEEKIAISNNSGYDEKGAWSGCVFTDDVLTGGKPNIFYTGVDYVRASINLAEPLTDDLINWKKDSRNPIIPGRPAGLSDDFRDPYVFKYNDNFYMIVGTSKSGKGASTLHKYDTNIKTWSNDGQIFYQSTSAAFGSFWEMPVIVPMPDGKWLFLVTTIGGNQGPETLYWVGTINNDGTFSPFSETPKEVELGTMGSSGYGLLSPSVIQKDGKTIAIGIVPDKLPSYNNLQLGWAHLYSLPREWSLDSGNNLIQQPFSGTQDLRTVSSAFSIVDKDIQGTQSLSPVSGKAVEIDGSFTVSNASSFGYHVRKTGSNYISVYYSPATNKITVDVQKVDRLKNDEGSFNGLYESVLPKKPNLGETMRIHLFIDHSIMDIFVNNQYAFSIRVFPIDPNADEVEVFSEGNSTHVISLKAWKLQSPEVTTEAKPLKNCNIRIFGSEGRLMYQNVPAHSVVTVYNLKGQVLSTTCPASDSGQLQLTRNQIYIVKIKGDSTFFTQKIFL